MIRMDSTRKKGNIYNGQMHSLNAPLSSFCLLGYKARHETFKIRVKPWLGT